MTDEKLSTIARLREDIDAGKTGSTVAAPDPAAGTDDESAGTPASADRVEMPRQAERKIGETAKRRTGGPSRNDEAIDKAHSQRGSSAPYAKEEHMNWERALQKEGD